MYAYVSAREYTHMSTAVYGGQKRSWRHGQPWCLRPDAVTGTEFGSSATVVHTLRYRAMSPASVEGISTWLPTTSLLRFFHKTGKDIQGTLLSRVLLATVGNA